MNNSTFNMIVYFGLGLFMLGGVTAAVGLMWAHIRLWCRWRKRLKESHRGSYIEGFSRRGGSLK